MRILLTFPQICLFNGNQVFWQHNSVSVIECEVSKDGSLDPAEAEITDKKITVEFPELGVTLTEVLT